MSVSKLSMHSVALEKAFQMMCLDLSLAVVKNPSNLTKRKRPCVFFVFVFKKLVWRLP